MNAMIRGKVQRANQADSEWVIFLIATLFFILWTVPARAHIADGDRVLTDWHLRWDVISALVIFATLSVGAQNTTQTQYLSGTGANHTVPWDFFCTGGHNSGYWTKIAVPSCWELQGFGNYNYAAAMAYALFLVIAIITFIQFKLFGEKD